MNFITNYTGTDRFVNTELSGLSNAITRTFLEGYMEAYDLLETELQKGGVGNEFNWNNRTISDFWVTLIYE